MCKKGVTYGERDDFERGEQIFPFCYTENT